MAFCTVTINKNNLAASRELIFIAMPHQWVDDMLVDTTPIYASASGNTYTVKLVKKAMYYSSPDMIGTDKPYFTVPNADSANLADLISGQRRG